MQAKFRTLIILTVATAMVLFMPKAIHANAPSEWAAQFVANAIEMGLVPEHLMYGYTQPITRAEFAALATRLYEHMGGEIIGRAMFVDTTDENVQKMGYLGVVTGVGDGRFDPYGTLTREQAAAILSRLSYALGWPPDEIAPAFIDNAAIQAWAYAPIGQMQSMGIMAGVGGGRFDPQGTYTREQSIITILRLHDLISPQMHISTDEPFRIPNRRLTPAEVEHWMFEYTATGGANAFERDVLDFVNAERERAGLSALAMDNTLMMAARFKAQSMVHLGYFDHTSPTYGHFANIAIEVFGFHDTGMAENIAWGMPTPRSVTDSWMASDGHRGSILNHAYTLAGVGYYEGHWVLKMAVD